MKLNFGPLSGSMRRDASTDLCKPVATIKDETCVWLRGISAVVFERGHDVGDIVVGGGWGKSRGMG